MTAICLVTGPSGAGKTTLVERLVPALAARGIFAATVKHHRGRIELDRPGKDSWRHRNAGAKATFLVTEAEVVAFLNRPPDMNLSDLAHLCPPEVQILIVEGFKGSTGYPRIEVLRRGMEREIAWSDDILCVATDREDLKVPAPVLRLDDAEGLADLLCRRLLSRDI